MHSLHKSQSLLCAKFNLTPCKASDDDKLGLSKGAIDGVMPLNGLRHPPTTNVTGWYIWGGEELSDADDFFKPYRVSHFESLCFLASKYLLLPPGWRFLTDGVYEDIWFDPSLLEAED